jgi:peptide-methionine (S)-S-oxide reductase
MSFLLRRSRELPSAETALPGRDAAMPVTSRHLVLDTPITPPFPDGFERIVVGMGCFWGAERLF